jgi:plasmid stability protein
MIDNSRRAVYGYDQRVEILGSQGSIATGNCYPNQAVISTATAVKRDLPLNFFMDRYTDSFASELRAFVAAVLEDKPTPVTGIDGRPPVPLAIIDCSAIIVDMASITIRRLDESTKARLRVRAAQDGRSMEEEAREILRAALAERRTGEGNLAGSIRRRFAAAGGVELADLPREPMRRPPKFGK